MIFKIFYKRYNPNKLDSISLITLASNFFFKFFEYLLTQLKAAKSAEDTINKFEVKLPSVDSPTIILGNQNYSAVSQSSVEGLQLFERFSLLDLNDS